MCARVLGVTDKTTHPLLLNRDATSSSLSVVVTRSIMDQLLVVVVVAGGVQLSGLARRLFTYISINYRSSGCWRRPTAASRPLEAPQWGTVGHRRLEGTWSADTSTAWIRMTSSTGDVIPQPRQAGQSSAVLLLGGRAVVIAAWSSCICLHYVTGR